MAKDIYERALEIHPYTDVVGNATRAKIEALQQRGLKSSELEKLKYDIQNGVAHPEDLTLFDHSTVTINPTSAAIYWITKAAGENQ